MRAVLLAALLLSGCSPVYVYKAWRGQARLMSARRPIEKVLADPAADAATKRKLELVLDVRRYAFETIGIPKTGNYSEYSKVDGPAVSWVVSGSKRTALEPKTWWFPFVGSVPYKGFFDKADAEAENAALEKDGWDAFYGGVSAYSTLRWFQDPVLSTMLEQPDGALAEVLIHELTHTALFFKSQVDFNEALATYVGETACRRFLAARYGADSKELAQYLKSLEEQEARSKLLDELYAELDALYKSPASDAEKLEKRTPIFERCAKRLGYKKLNNAVLLSQRRYRYDLSDFRRAHEKAGNDWRKFLDAMKALDRRSPREDLKRRLDGTRN
ncbi:MAG: aminopeptidase [Elusimicrobia bacterium]|nr:aminopeptidase [Elusimicrobiota bacterium]